MGSTQCTSVTHLPAHVDDAAAALAKEREEGLGGGDEPEEVHLGWTNGLELRGWIFFLSLYVI